MSIRTASPLAGLAAAALLGALALVAPAARAQDEAEAPAAGEAAAEAEVEPAPESETAADATVEADAEALGAADVALVRECLATLSARGAPARVCMDIVTRSCATQPDGDTTAGAAACEERGRYAWITLLAEVSAALEDGMSNTERERYAAAQDAWAAFRDAQCAYEAALFEGEALQSAERIACERRLTAERAVALHERAASLEQR
jgi:uncharacterized protein YecT (DUF1311 family)